MAFYFVASDPFHDPTMLAEQYGWHMWWLHCWRWAWTSVGGASGAPRNLFSNPALWGLIPRIPGLPRGGAELMLVAALHLLLICMCFPLSALIMRGIHATSANLSSTGSQPSLLFSLLPWSQRIQKKQNKTKAPPSAVYFLHISSPLLPPYLLSSLSPFFPPSLLFLLFDIVILWLYSSSIFCCSLLPSKQFHGIFLPFPPNPCIIKYCNTVSWGSYPF